MMKDVLRVPGPLRVVEGWLGADIADRLLERAIGLTAAFTDGRIGVDSGRVDVSIRQVQRFDAFDSLVGEDRELAGLVTARLKGLLDDSLKSFGMPPIALARLELELVAYGHGGFYLRHIDTLAGDERDAADPARGDRVLSAVCYLHRRPRRFTGGDLRLHAIVGDAFVDVEPVHDRLVLFPSWLPHEVRAVSCPDSDFADSRFALIGWFRRSRTP